MIHLFNRTYLDIDDFIETNENRVVVSVEHGNEMLGVLASRSSGTQFAFAQNTDELLNGEDGNFSSWAEFFEFCYDCNESENRRLFIYADDTALPIILAAAHKFIFDNIDAASSYRVYKAAYVRNLYVNAREVFYLENQLVESKISLEDYTTAFNAVTVDISSAEAISAYNKIKTSHSLEFLIASYFYNESNVSDIKSVLLKMLTRYVEEQFKEALTIFKRNALKSSLQSGLGTSSYTLDNLEDFINDPAIASLKRTNAWRAVTSVGTGGRTPLDLSTYTDEEITVLKQQVQMFNYFIDSPDMDTMDKVHYRIITYIDIIRNNSISDDDVETILNYEVNSNDDDRFWPLADRANVNGYFIDYLMIQKRNSMTSSLAPYLLRS